MIVEETMHDHFYEGLNPEYQQMLAHKVDGENPAGYSDLLLATWKLERRAEARDPLPPKTAVTSGLNTCSQTPGNLFPLHKLKGNHTFTAQAASIGNDAGEADSGVKQEKEGDTEPSADEEVEASGTVEGINQHMEYIISFIKAVELHQQKNRSCFGCKSPDTSCGIAQKTLANLHGKLIETLEGIAKKGGWAPQKPAATQQTCPGETPQM